jgi:hypothetical protein
MGWKLLTFPRGFRSYLGGDEQRLVMKLE